MEAEEFPPEFVNASNAGRIVGVVGVFHFIAFTFVSLRLYVRLFMVRGFGIDDVLIVVAVLLALGSWICLILQIPYGLGRHGLTIPVEDRTNLEHISFWKTVLSDGLALGLLRISMAITLLRFAKDRNWYKWSIYAVIGFVTAYTIQSIAWLFVYCTPYSGWWEFQWMNPQDPRCHDFTLFLNLTYWNIACNIFTDVCLGALPVPIIWTLKMKLRVRLYVIAILNLGYFAVVMGILKFAFMLTTAGDPDNTFDYWVHFWQNLQLNIGIIAACASFLKPLLGRLLKLNTTVATYPTYPQYDRSHRTQVGSGYAPGSRRTRISHKGIHDDFEMQYQTNIQALERQVSPPVERYQVAQGSSGSQSPSRPEYYKHQPSDTESEDILLQQVEPAHGIVRTREYVVKYGDT